MIVDAAQTPVALGPLFQIYVQCFIFETSIPFKGSILSFTSSRNCSLVGLQQQKQNIENIITITNKAAGIPTATPRGAICFTYVLLEEEEVQLLEEQEEDEDEEVGEQHLDE